MKLSGKTLRNLGYPEGPVISLAINIVAKHFKHNTEKEVLEMLQHVLNVPEHFLDDEVLKPIALKLRPEPNLDEAETRLNEEGVSYQTFGVDYIEEGAMHQMVTAAKLPIAVAGALMPDAHQGYGLPIGGVLATENAVIPYGVGVDIGCRMCLSVFAIDPFHLKDKTAYFKREILENTVFGSGGSIAANEDHPVLHDAAFKEIPLLKSLQNKAWQQLGTSGSGNHFVEFGIVRIEKYDEVLQLPAGNYVGLLSHSGSRGLGANVANHYTKVAMSKRQLPKEAKNLAWLYLSEQEGMEYWTAMNLAGDYAAACHHRIHEKIARQLGEQPLKMVENHHNFAWKEIHAGKEVIVHRKGATPAGKNVLGIIPGSMTANGYIVKGRGFAESLSSASHGAGRRMSRSKALEQITQAQMRDELAQYDVQLLGGGLDEAPFAYKDIDQVMQAQQDLVDIVGTFTPKIVRMDGTPPRVKKGKRLDGE